MEEVGVEDEAVEAGVEAEAELDLWAEKRNEARARKMKLTETASAHYDLLHHAGRIRQ